MYGAGRGNGPQGAFRSVNLYGAMPKQSRLRSSVPAHKIVLNPRAEFVGWHIRRFTLRLFYRCASIGLRRVHNGMVTVTYNLGERDARSENQLDRRTENKKRVINTREVIGGREVGRGQNQVYDRRDVVNCRREQAIGLQMRGASTIQRNMIAGKCVSCASDDNECGG